MKRSLGALLSGGAVYGLAAANGYAWEMLWLPAVLLAAAWPPSSSACAGGCVRRLLRRE